MTLTPLAELLSRKRLLVFDLDGTLVDSSPLHARAYAEVFAPEGIEVDYTAIAGMTTDAAVDKLAAEAGLTLAPERRARLVAAKKARALGLIETELAPIEGAVEFVTAARRRFAVALCTSASRPSVAAALARVGLAGCFDPLVTAEDVVRGKPDPEAFLMTLAAHGTAPDEALVFEDSQSGLEAAARAGIDAVRIAADPADAAATAWPSLLAALRELP
jgi:HAD superfamily hydrolase (TIGR01509 family)